MLGVKWVQLISCLRQFQLRECTKALQWKKPKLLDHFFSFFSTSFPDCCDPDSIWALSSTQRWPDMPTNQAIPAAPANSFIMRVCLFPLLMMGWNECVWVSYKHHPNTRQGAQTVCLEVDGVAFFSAQEMESSIASHVGVDSSTYSGRGEW